MAVVRPSIWCISKIPILKWLQMICSLVVIIFIDDGRYQWFIYTAIFLICIVLIVCTFLTLVVLYVGIKNTYNIELVFNLVAFSLCLLAGSLLTYDLIQMVSGNFAHHQYLTPTYIGRDSWKNRIAVCTVFLLLETLFYQASFVLTKQKGRGLDQ
ncbi:hypothetical protein X798_05076 [Onchocerca flexuosa]|uniref:MARVEL domain-containing protein n=1 Tax=Onchocerca flexuosa TaxID=387005 RepID=A0A238BS94_9BILA|nr:hypothetical protein X798_05076 [Onchocerca flexuosa]